MKINIGRRERLRKSSSLKIEISEEICSRIQFMRKSKKTHRKEKTLKNQEKKLFNFGYQKLILEK
jgi:hypothetical protein